MEKGKSYGIVCPMLLIKKDKAFQIHLNWISIEIKAASGWSDEHPLHKKAKSALEQNIRPCKDNIRVEKNYYF